jgi:hypothetical protein
MDVINPRIWKLAEDVFRNARTSNRGRPVGLANIGSNLGTVIVAWDRIEKRYEVGNAAQNMAIGKRSEVLPTLLAMINRVLPYQG